MALTKNSDSNYSLVTKVFHWLLALLIIGMLIVGNWMEDLQGLEKFKIYGLHKATGIVVLFLVFLRFAWRQATYQPPVPYNTKLSATLNKLVEFCAKASHAALYLLMFGMPITGWLMSSAYGFPVSVYGWFVMPNLISPDKELAELMKDAHGVMANILIILIIAHLSAALFHRFYLKDIIMRRMLPIIALVLIPLAANSAEFEVDKSKSWIKFEAIQNNAPVMGEFKDYDAKINFDTMLLDKSTAKVEVKMASVYAAYDEMVQNLKATDWFNASKFPTAKFSSEKFTKLDDGNYEMAGNLTIRDVTKPIVIKFNLIKYDNNAAIIDGTANISRTSFGVGQNEWKDTGVVKDDVKLNIHLEANVKKS